jgi:hypothetical protein
MIKMAEDQRGCTSFSFYCFVYHYRYHYWKHLSFSLSLMGSCFADDHYHQTQRNESVSQVVQNKQCAGAHTGYANVNDFVALYYSFCYHYYDFDFDDHVHDFVEDFDYFVVTVLMMMMMLVMPSLLQYFDDYLYYYHYH